MRISTIFSVLLSVADFNILWILFQLYNC